MISTVDNITVLPEGQPGAVLLISGRWNANKEYTRDSEVIPLVEHDGLFYSLNKIGAVVGGLNPKDDYAKLGSKATWKLQNSYEMIIVKAVVADGGLLGDFVFWGGKMFSKQGIDKQGNFSDKYTEYPKGNFIPNYSVDALTGKVYGYGSTFEKADIKDATITNAFITDAYVEGRVVSKPLDITKENDIDLSKSYSFNLRSVNGIGGTVFKLPEWVNNDDLYADVKIFNRDSFDWVSAITTAGTSSFMYHTPWRSYGKVVNLVQLPLSQNERISLSPVFTRKRTDTTSFVDWAAYFDFTNVSKQYLEIRDSGFNIGNRFCGNLKKEDNVYQIPRDIIDFFDVHTIWFENKDKGLRYAVETDYIGRSIMILSGGDTVWINSGAGWIAPQLGKTQVILTMVATGYDSTDWAVIKHPKDK